MGKTDTIKSTTDNIKKITSPRLIGDEGGQIQIQIRGQKNKNIFLKI